MPKTNRALQATVELIQKNLPQAFGAGFRISHIESTSLQRNNRDVNYMTVYLEPDHPPLDDEAIVELDIQLREMLIAQHIFDKPAVAYIDRDDSAA